MPVTHIRKSNQNFHGSFSHFFPKDGNPVNVYSYDIYLNFEIKPIFEVVIQKLKIS